MIDLSDLSLSFEAQYRVEDAASYILYKFNKDIMQTSFVSAEQFAHFIGVNLFCDYVFEDSYNLGIIALEPQRVRALDKKIDLPRNSVLIESNMLTYGFKLYNYFIMLACARLIYSEIDICRQELCDIEQISFGLDTVESENHIVCSLYDIFEDCLCENYSEINNFALCLLMPKNKFKMATNALYNSCEVNRSTVLNSNYLDLIIDSLSETFQTPKMFVFIRLLRLNYI